ncbi:hypothetical protein ACQCVB_00275 [Fictibacillus phosphorivorans]|uniref:hypothetical protein n=1 Tax=Fictibacillus phosphorivorans TaxID=1221500 RepID=UPI003CECEDD9
MEKTGYILGFFLQIVFTLIYFLSVAALISDLSYLYDRQAFAGAERVLYAGFFKQLILYTIIYVVLMIIAQAFKSAYKRLKKKQKLEQRKLST